MSITDNKIYYAIRIDTGTTENLPELGMVNGVITLITGLRSAAWPCYDEDGTLLNVSLVNGLLTKKGIDAATIQGDIDTSGDYANLSGFSFSIVNKTVEGTTDKTYNLAVEDLTEAYLEGAKVNYFICFNFFSSICFCSHHVIY